MKKILFYLLSTIFIIFSTNGYSSTQLPTNIQSTLEKAYQQFKSENKGKIADYIPELAKVNPALFGIAIITVNGDYFSVGDANVPFAIESISKPFAYALALIDNGEEVVTKKVGLNATGRPFNSVIAIEDLPNHLQNPYVNAGAIQISSLIKGKNSSDKWQHIFNFFQQLSDGKLSLGEAVYQSEMATNQHNRAIAELFESYNMINSDPMDAVDRYTKACSIMVTSKQLAIMGATLANNGTHPLTHQQIIAPNLVRDVLSEMVVNGLYENSGIWFFNVGLPAKSGVGGGILAIVPNKMAIVVYSPPLDEAGNSIRAEEVIQYLSEQWHLHILQQ
jgi:glutaminase